MMLQAADPRCIPAARARLTIFAVAIILRAAAGAIFLGSIDLVNSATNSLALLDGRAVNLPYFPGINPFLWFGGVLAATSHVPYPLALKLAPILFDSFMAVLIHDLVAGTEPGSSFRAGLLYATSPLALLVTSFHGQWDSIALFLLLLAFAVRGAEDGERTERELAFGGLFGLSVLAKPIALPFLLLFPRRQGDRAPLWVPLAGVLFVGCAVFSVMGICGYPPLAALARIAVYSARGVQLFGAPFSPLLASLPLQHWRGPWLAVIMILLAMLYHRRRLAANNVMLLFYCIWLATAGFSPQYLIWPIPFLLVSRRIRLASAYTCVSTVFLLFYYSNPWTSYYAFENMATFAPLRSMAWLAPPAAMAARGLLPVVRTLGNIVVPAVTLAIAIAVARTSRKYALEKSRELQPRSLVAYAIPALLLFAVILAATAVVNVPATYQRLVEVWQQLPAAYAIRVRPSVPQALLIRECGNPSPFNVVVLLAVFTAIWCASAWKKSIIIWSTERRDKPK